MTETKNLILMAPNEADAIKFSTYIEDTYLKKNNNNWILCIYIYYIYIFILSDNEDKSA